MKQGEWFLSFRLRKTFVKEFCFICFVDMYVMLLWGCAWGHNPYRGQKLLFQSGFSPTKCGSLNCTWFVKLREKSLYVLRHLPTTLNYCQLSELRLSAIPTLLTLKKPLLTGLIRLPPLQYSLENVILILCMWFFHFLFFKIEVLFTLILN